MVHLSSGVPGQHLTWCSPAAGCLTSTSRGVAQSLELLQQPPLCDGLQPGGQGRALREQQGRALREQRRRQCGIRCWALQPAACSAAVRHCSRAGMLQGGVRGCLSLCLPGCCAAAGLGKRGGCCRWCDPPGAARHGWPGLRCCCNCQVAHAAGWSTGVAHGCCMPGAWAQRALWQVVPVLPAQHQGA